MNTLQSVAQVQSFDCSMIKPNNASGVFTVSKKGARKLLREEELSVRKIASGWLVKEIKNVRQKNGAVISYPRVLGERNPGRAEHWYWHYCWELRTDEGWQQKRIYLPSEKVYWVRSLIEANTPIRDILRHLGKNPPPPPPSKELKTAALAQGGVR